ncbi:MAG: hypothetical protein WAT74_05530 [Flavobacteriales bacterium]
MDRWNAIPEHHPGTRLDELQIMPDHLHAILVLAPPTNIRPVAVNGELDQSLGIASVGATQGVDATGALNERGARPKGPAPGSLGAIIGAFKSVTTKRINAALGRHGGTIWQHGYYERVIRRHGGEYRRIAQYIAENPAKWT